MRTMSNESPTNPPSPTSSNELGMDQRSNTLARRDFIRVAGAGAGMLLVGGSLAPAETPRRVPGLVRSSSIRATSRSSDIIVIGAGGWGSFTALNLRKMGANVTLVDAYGPGNARSTSGDETRGVRSSYGDRIMRTEWDNCQLRGKIWWDKDKTPYQVRKPDDVRKACPVTSMDDITAV